jgi:hypothetical protein
VTQEKGAAVQGGPQAAKSTVDFVLNKTEAVPGFQARR